MANEKTKKLIEAIKEQKGSIAKEIVKALMLEKIRDAVSKKQKDLSKELLDK